MLNLEFLRQVMNFEMLKVLISILSFILLLSIKKLDNCYHVDVVCYVIMFIFMWPRFVIVSYSLCVYLHLYLQLFAMFCNIQMLLLVTTFLCLVSMHYVFYILFPAR